MDQKIAVLSVVLASLLTVSVSAHPGKTDVNGGHYNSATGEYHYHHGYPAHQHPDGVCPYDFDDQTDHSNAEPIINDTNSYIQESSGTISSTRTYMEGFFKGTDSGYADAKRKFDDGITQLSIDELSRSNTKRLFFSCLGAFLFGALLVFMNNHKKINNLKRQLQDTLNVANTANNAYSDLLEVVEADRKRLLEIRSQIENLTSTVPPCPSFVYADDFDDDEYSEDDSDLENTDTNDYLMKHYSTDDLLEGIFATANESEQSDRFERALSQEILIMSMDISSPPNVSAEVLGTSGEEYHTTLTHCSCPDFQHRHRPCKHMYCLAIEVARQKQQGN